MEAASRNASSAANPATRRRIVRAGNRQPSDAEQEVPRIKAEKMAEVNAMATGGKGRKEKEQGIVHEF